jgi:hypothetical protein
MTSYRDAGWETVFVKRSSQRWEKQNSWEVQVRRVQFLFEEKQRVEQALRVSGMNPYQVLIHPDVRRQQKAIELAYLQMTGRVWNR